MIPMFCHRRRSGPSFTGILDQLSTAALAAYSLRALVTDFAGTYAIQVRESGGDTLADIGFDANGDLDTAALLAHCGSNSGFVKIWYDQSGNGRNLVQATAGQQMRIVSSGVLDTQDGSGAIKSLDGNDWLVTAAFTPISTDEIYCGLVGCQVNTSSGSNRRIIGVQNNNGGQNDNNSVESAALVKFNAGNTSYNALRNSATLDGQTLALDNLAVIHSAFDGVANYMSLGTAAFGAGVASTGTFEVAIVMLNTEYAFSVNNAALNSYCEALVFPAMLSSGDQGTLKANQADYYGL